MGGGAGEDARLAELRSYAILDTPAEPAFDHLTQLAARVCDTPMALVTLIDADRQWFKSRIGIERRETDRTIAFCAHAIEQPGPFVVPDALADDRFAANALVVEEPHIRFYHGIPLVNRRGFALGTLAVLDRDPRQLDDLQADLLAILAEQAMLMLEQHRQSTERDAATAELERLNARLTDAARRYDELYRTNPLPMWISDVESRRFLDVNDAALAVYGWEREEFLAMTIDEIRPEEDVAEFRRLLADVADEQYYEMGPLRHRRADGTVFPVMIGAHRVEHDGRPARLVFVRDITEVEAAERRLAEAAQLLVSRLTVIVEVWRHLSDGEPTLDELYDAIPGLTMDVLGADGAALYLAEGSELVPRAFTGYLTMVPRMPIVGSLAGWTYLNGRATRSADYTADPRVGMVVPRPDGSRSVVLAPVEGLDGPVGIIVALDRRAGHFDESDERSLDLLARALGAIIRRVVAEAGRRASEERLEQVVRATADAIYDWNVMEGSVWWDPAIEELFGHAAGELMATPSLWVDLIHPDDIDRITEEMMALLRDRARTVGVRTYRVRRSDGTYGHVRDRSTVIRRDDGRGIRVVGGMSDVTEQVEAEARALQSQRLEAIGQLTGGIAHDFNNLLTVILGNADQLVADLESRPELRELVEMTRSAAVRGAELSQRLLAFARRQALEPKPVDPNRLLEHLDGLLRRTLPESVELELVRGAGTWPAFVDRGQLENALLNLCLNSRDVMPDGGRITIETANARIDQDDADRHAEVGPGQYVMIAVSDTGPGIPADIIDRVVEPFFTTKQPDVGSGLGLSMVDGFVKQSGGHMTIESEPGEGTTVRLHLPRSTSAATTVDTSIDTTTTSITTSTTSITATTTSSAVTTVDRTGGVADRDRPDVRGSEQILLVEDDDLVRQLATRHLRSLGYEVLVAASGPEAIEVLRRDGPVDLLFTDVVMPGGISGAALAHAAIEMQPDLRVLYTSGYADDAIVHHGRLDAGVHLLGKPYRPTDLARKVRAVLDDRDG